MSSPHSQAKSVLAKSKIWKACQVYSKLSNMYLLCYTQDSHVDLKWHEGQQIMIYFWVNYSFKICETFGYRRMWLFWRPVFVVVVVRSGDEVAKISHRDLKAKLLCSCFDQTVSSTFLLLLQSRKARKNMWPEAREKSWWPFLNKPECCFSKERNICTITDEHYLFMCYIYIL